MFVSVCCEFPYAKYVPLILCRLIVGDPGAISRVERTFQAQAEEPWAPTLTEPFQNGHANAGLNPDWAQKMLCITVLCPIGKQHLLSSFRVFVHNCYCLAIIIRFVHQGCGCKANFYSLLS